MDKLQAENEKRLLQHEKEAFKQLKSSYTNALADIKARVRILQSSIDDLTDIDTSNFTEEQLKIHKSQIQSKVYQLEYQKTLSKQVGAIVDILKQDTVQNVQSYLDKVYQDSYLGIQYYINQKGIPITTPINPSEVVNVVNKKIEDMTYADRVNANMNEFKKTIKAEISRGIASGSSYKEIASNLSMVTGEEMYKSERIVRTEGARVSSTAKLTSIRDMKEQGADLVKVWDSTLDGKTRPEHGLLDGQWAEVNKPFKVAGYKVEAPGMFGDPSQDCNCRCVLLSLPRWDIDDNTPMIKYDNEHDELVEVMNYQDWKKGYFRKIAEQETKDNTPKKGFVKANDIKEVEQRMGNLLGTNNQKLNNMNMKLANEYLEGMEEFLNEYPMMKDFTKSINTKINPRENAHYGLGFKRENGKVVITNTELSLRNPRDYNKFLENMKYAEEINYQFKGYTPKTIMVHELTHGLEFKAGAVIKGSYSNGEFIEVPFEHRSDMPIIGLANNIIKEARIEMFGKEHGKEVYEGMKFLGSYAFTNSAEALAECIAYEMTVGTNPFSAKVKELFDKKIKEVFK